METSSKITTISWKTCSERVILKGHEIYQMVTNGTSHIMSYHPAKRGKIRVVFDCSTEYLGYALSKQLIPGSDLTNQIIGVLIKFREEKFAFMGDIEAMFYHIQIPECQRSMLRFLWWEGNNFSNQPTDHLMCSCIWRCIIAKLLQLCTQEDCN